ncbi:MAG: circadian clock KaiB family protein [bacterium]|nr:circadian clock KaiB family protein [bacterium]
MMTDRVILKLYVAGTTPRSERAIQNIRQIRADFLVENCDILIIDVLEEPQQAEDAKILATPTLVREAPPPQRRIIGDLSDLEKVLWALNLGRGGAAV